MDPVDPFHAATEVRSLGDGSFVADLDADWAVGEHPNGGYLLALLCRAAIAESHLSPLSVSAQFLRAPKVGPVLIRVEQLKIGRLVTVLRTVLEQAGKPCVDAAINLGELPDVEPEWADVPDMPVNPPPGALDVGSMRAVDFEALVKACEIRLDPDGAGFLNGNTPTPPRLRLWVRPRAAEMDPMFALVASDLSVPVTFNLGRFGWAPTVQLTALLRAKPANGWLRLLVGARAVHGPWFDEDALVIDSTGRVVCQARQLALSQPS